MRNSFHSLVKKIAVKMEYNKNTLYRVYLKMMGLKITPGTIIRGKIRIIGDPSNIILGKKVSINEGVLLNARDKIIIGNNVTLSNYVQIHTGKLDLSSYDHFIKRRHKKEKIIIEDNVWIAAGVIVSPGVKIGKNSVIGAGSVVTRDIPPNSFAAGVPAKVIKNIDK